MGFSCSLLGHKWQGCKCIRKSCTETRDEGHEYGDERDEQCNATCKFCGKKATAHFWDVSSGKCEHCGRLFEATWIPQLNFIWTVNAFVLGDTPLDEAPPGAHLKTAPLNMSAMTFFQPNFNEVIASHYKTPEKKYPEQRRQLRQKLENGGIPAYTETALFGYCLSTHIVAGIGALKTASENLQREALGFVMDRNALVRKQDMIKQFAQELDSMEKILLLICSSMGQKGNAPEAFDALYSMCVLGSAAKILTDSNEKAAGDSSGSIGADSAIPFPLLTDTKLRSGGICDVCSMPLNDKIVYIVPNDVFYSSQAYRDFACGENSSLARVGFSTRGGREAALDNQAVRDNTPGSAVCENCIHMFIKHKVESKPTEAEQAVSPDGRYYYIFATTPSMAAFSKYVPANVVINTPPLITLRNKLYIETEAALANDGKYQAAKKKCSERGIKAKEVFLEADDVLEGTYDWIAKEEGIARDELQQYFAVNIWGVKHIVTTQDPYPAMGIANSSPPPVKPEEDCAVFFAFFEGDKKTKKAEERHAMQAQVHSERPSYYAFGCYDHDRVMSLSMANPNAYSKETVLRAALPKAMPQRAPQSPKTNATLSGDIEYFEPTEWNAPRVELDPSDQVEGFRYDEKEIVTKIKKHLLGLGLADSEIDEALKAKTTVPFINSGLFVIIV